VILRVLVVFNQMGKQSRNRSADGMTDLPNCGINTQNFRGKLPFPYLLSMIAALQIQGGRAIRQAIRNRTEKATIVAIRQVILSASSLDFDLNS
jgi:hypothetical protein